MIRTQISLTDEQKRLLDEESGKTGLSISELIRRAVDQRYTRSAHDAEALSRSLRRAQGVWRDRDFDGERYVESLRSGARLKTR
jgi:hypothetical protein